MDTQDTTVAFKPVDCNPKALQRQTEKHGREQIVHRQIHCSAGRPSALKTM